MARYFLLDVKYVDMGCRVIYTLLMLKASHALKVYIASQKSKIELAERLGVSRQTVHLIEHGGAVSSKMVSKLLDISGFGFDEAFEVVK